jgi:hypothetical protein
MLGSPTEWASAKLRTYFGTVLFVASPFHSLPDLPRRTSGLGNVLPRQLRIAFGHLDIRVARNFLRAQRSPPFIMNLDANV